MNETEELLIDLESEGLVENDFLESESGATIDELKSDEIDDIISKKPNVIVRYGISVIGVGVLLIILMSWFVRYPEILRTEMDIMALNAPKKVTSKYEGKIQNILVKNGTLVVEGQPLAFISNIGNHNDVFEMLNWINKVNSLISADSISLLSSVTLPRNLDIGELQNDHQNFSSIYQEALQTLLNGFYIQQLAGLKKDITYLNKQSLVLIEQRKLLQHDYELQKKEYEMHEVLAQKQAISSLQLDNKKSELIRKTSVLHQLDERLLTQEVSRHNKEKEIRESKKKIEDIQNELISAVLIYKSKIEEWIEKYVVLSPENGKIQFVTMLQKNQSLSNGQELFYIEPDNSLFFGEIMAQQEGFGKIKVGQSVNIHLDSYPSNEFGYVQGEISYISALIIHDNSYLIHVTLPEHKKTTHNYIIPFKNKMKAKAEVIVEEQRLLSKLFLNISEKLKR